MRKRDLFFKEATGEQTCVRSALVGFILSAGLVEPVEP